MASRIAASDRLRPPPERFLEIWADFVGGFLFSVTLPIPIYATGTPFAERIGATEQTILATAVAYLVVWYCGRRLDSVPHGDVDSNVSYIAPVAFMAYAIIAIALLLFRSEYSRVQFAGSGALTIIWMTLSAWIRSHYLVRQYAVMPASSIGTLPHASTSRWLTVERAMAENIRIDAIVAELGSELGRQEMSILAGAAINGIPILDRRYVLESLSGRTPLGGLTPNEFGALLPSRQYLVLRRAVELLLTFLVLPLLAPLLAAIAIGVRLDSAGPILFVQTRAGRRGRTFPMIKFRTMYHNATGPSFTLAGDSRITRIGSFLRRSRLDELPQVVNVLRGDMSWVGPRPEALQLEQKYLRSVPHFALRGIIRPGITGWSQVHQHEFSPDEGPAKLEYDLYYLKYCSLWLDLRIILRTVRVIVSGSGGH